MATLPADVSPGDSNHDDHHDALHALYNFFEGVPSGRLVLGGGGVGSLSSSTLAALVSKTYVDALGINAATLEGDDKATVLAAAVAAVQALSSSAGIGFVVDEDDMVSDLATKVPTQQSVKAHVASQVAGVSGRIVYIGTLRSEFPTTGVQNGDCAFLTQADGADPAGIYEYSSSAWALRLAVPTFALIDDDTFSADSATNAASQQSIKAYVDAAIAGVTAGSGRAINTATHASPGALSVTRAATDQSTEVSVAADITSFTDNLTDGDYLEVTLVSGAAADYTADLSGITDWANPAETLTDALNIYVGTVAVLLVRKIQGVLYGTLDVPAAGSAQVGSSTVRGYYSAGGVSVPTVSASSLTTAPVSGDGLLFVVVAAGPSAQATVNFTAPSGATQVSDYAGSGYSPRVRTYSKTYAGESDWTFGSDSGITRVAVIAINGLTTFDEGTTVATLDPGSVANPAGGIGFYIGTAAWDAGDDSTWTGAPSGHTLLFDNRASVSTQPNMQLQVATLALSSAGTYDPDAAGFGPSAQAYSSVAIAATA